MPIIWSGGLAHESAADGIPDLFVDQVLRAASNYWNRMPLGVRGRASIVRTPRHGRSRNGCVWGRRGSEYHQRADPRMCIMWSVSTVAGRLPSSPAIAARSVPWPRPVSAREP